MRVSFRFALEEIWRHSQREGTSLGDLTIITGQGRGSLHAFQPVVSGNVFGSSVLVSVVVDDEGGDSGGGGGGGGGDGGGGDGGVGAVQPLRQ